MWPKDAFALVLVISAPSMPWKTGSALALQAITLKRLDSRISASCSYLVRYPMHQCAYRLVGEVLIKAASTHGGSF